MSCKECGRPYGDKYGFPDLIIPTYAWKQISPSGGEGGLLCPSCICKRLHSAGIRCPAYFASGPLTAEDYPVWIWKERLLWLEERVESLASRRD